MAMRFRPGDCVIYRKLKRTVHPGPRAEDIDPAPNGDTYSYCVPKFYRVVDVEAGRSVVVRTKKGRQHTLAVDDPALRRAR